MIGLPLAMEPHAGQRADATPDEQGDTGAGQERSTVDGEPDRQEDRSDDSANDGTVVTAEEKQHGKAPLFVR
jgi:hypothetical protein